MRFSKKFLNWFFALSAFQKGVNGIGRGREVTKPSLIATKFSFMLAIPILFFSFVDSIVSNYSLIDKYKVFQKWSSNGLGFPLILTYEYLLTQ